VIATRTVGVGGAIHLAPRRGAAGRRALEAHVKCFEAGVLVRCTADILALSPPLIIEKAQVEQLVETIRSVLQTID